MQIGSNEDGLWTIQPLLKAVVTLIHRELDVQRHPKLPLSIPILGDSSARYCNFQYFKLALGRMSESNHKTGMLSVASGQGRNETEGPTF
jgi:hypothetical protein